MMVRCPVTGSAPVQASEGGTERVGWNSPETFPRASAGPSRALPPPSLPELFPAPVLRATPSPEPQAGSTMTLSCQTKLPLQRSATRLLFSFHKGGWAVRVRGLSPELQVPAASEAHSGSYWCEATTEDNHVWKRSSRLEVRVQGEWVLARMWKAGQDEVGGPAGVSVSRGTAEPGPWKLQEYRRDFSPDQGTPLHSRTMPAPQLWPWATLPPGTWARQANSTVLVLGAREPCGRNQGRDGAARGRGLGSSMKVPPRGGCIPSSGQVLPTCRGP